MSDQTPEVTSTTLQAKGYALSDDLLRTTLQAGDRKVTVPLSPQIVEDGILEGRWSREDKREALRIVEGHDAE